MGFNMGYETSKPYTGKIINLIKQTWNLPDACKVRKNGVTYYNYVFPSVDHTDGIGTKGMYHWQHRTFKAAVLDALAMNINDLYMIGAFPAFKLQNHLFVPQDDHKAIEKIMLALVAECKKRNIAVSGGETSIHNNMEGMDISITMSGMFRGRENRYQLGDTLIGLPSSGLHSNGFTKVRELLGGDRDEYVQATRIYDDIPSVYYRCNGLNHITGGAFTKLKHNLPENANAVLYCLNSHDVPKIFHELFKAGCTSKEMYRTFNCGYGFVLSVPHNQVGFVLDSTDGDVIGEVVSGNGKVIISSAFDGESVIYE
jgi:phosphoribosylformylglycinamidine cyclo-ligase